jgi:hypothetical protein
LCKGGQGCLRARKVRLVFGLKDGVSKC